MTSYFHVMGHMARDWREDNVTASRGVRVAWLAGCFVAGMVGPARWGAKLAFRTEIWPPIITTTGLRCELLQSADLKQMYAQSEWFNQIKVRLLLLLVLRFAFFACNILESWAVFKRRRRRFNVRCIMNAVNILPLWLLYTNWSVASLLVNYYVRSLRENYREYLYLSICVRVLQNSDVRQMYLNAQSEWLNHISVSITL